MKARKRSGIPRNDTLQMLLDSGEGHFTIVGVSILLPNPSRYSSRYVSLVYDGFRNGRGAIYWYCRQVRHPIPRGPGLPKEADFISASWLVTYLGYYPKWRNEVRAEVEKLITSHSPGTVSECNSTTALSSIPLSAWENETPVLDMLIREVVRLSQAFVSLRRNVGPELYIDGKVIPTGALVVYPAADVHLDPALYPDPWKFDPARSRPKGNLTYLGWGGGVCLCLNLLPNGLLQLTLTIPPYIYISLLLGT